MKTCSLIVLLGLMACAIGAAPASGARAKKTAVQASANAGGTWCRTVDGRSVRVPNKTESAKTAAGTPAPAQSGTAVGTYSYYRPTIETSYPDSARPETVNGVEWYLNGRSYFSD
jgi:hypothetical protein